MQEPVEKYVQAAIEDLETAQILQSQGRCFYVPFLCHQALNKVLRGYYLDYLNRYPPITDDLLAIADDTEAGLRMDESTRTFVNSLSVWPQIVGNPVYRQKIIEQTSPENTKDILEQTGKIVEMVRSLINQYQTI